MSALSFQGELLRGRNVVTVTTDITDSVLLDIGIAYSSSLNSFTLGAFAYE